MAQVVILGGGFGGLAAAHELRELLPTDDEIVLVARDERFYMGFAKLWDLGRVRPIDEGTRSLTALNDRGVRFVPAEITAIDPSSRRVETSAGPIEGEALLVGLGAIDAPPHVAMLRGERTFNLYDGNELPAMHAALDEIEEGRIVVSILGGPFKCPPAPYEAILLVDERLRERGVRDAVELTISTPQPITLPVAGPDASAYVARHVEDRDIEIRAKAKVENLDAGAGAVTFDDGSTLDYTLFFGVPATAPPPVVQDSPLAAESGWIMPDPRTLQTDFDRVYAVGDCTAIPNAVGQLPKAGVFAAGEASVAAENIAADLHGGDRAEFDGRGYCFLELPGKLVAFVEGDFYAEPQPDVTLSEADHEQFERKLAFERERLDAWLG